MSKISTKPVFPTGPEDAKILVIGEAPGADEEREGKPFVGRAGEILWDAFKRYGISRDQVRVTNLSEYRPENNIFAFLAGSDQLIEGIKHIYEYLIDHKPNVVALVGDKPLQYLTGRNGIYAQRSSILPLLNLPKQKCVPILHPAGLFRFPQSYLFFDFDVRRVVEESLSSEFNYTPREYILVKDFLLPDVYEELMSSPLLGVDIEVSKKDKVPINICFAVSRNKSVSVAWNQHNFPLIKSILENPQITKVFHYGFMFDIECLFLYGINVAGQIHDTYVMQQVLDPTLPRSLAFLTTTYTREPYYKKVGRDGIPEDTKVWSDRVDKDELFVYNAKDGAVTVEIYEKIRNNLEIDNLYDYYLFKLQSASAAQKISRQGLLLDTERQDLFKRALLYKWTRLQQVLNMFCNRQVNANSSQGKTSIQHLLYEEIGLPARRNREGKPRADEKALLSLIAYCQGEVDTKKTEKSKSEWTVKLEICKIIIEIRQIRKLLSSYLDVDISLDGRIRSMFNSSGTETSRWSASKYVDDTGLNAMTFPRGSVPIPDDLPEGDIESKLIIEQLKEEMTKGEEE